ncbi:hypothetical protein TWF102_007704 [Orbilia oligospora]|uniref:Uncharacterized protein n=1 Tax=Orbilia oligospora TaxID=2813651 RepID=A0A7C8JCP9_ORBOL|nr:hypothetical protein TWF102_007704 [Orbilia oligospora]KAF3130538.1 hypothetical protein TWF594_010294 [Orbilia oligospora]
MDDDVFQSVPKVKRLGQLEIKTLPDDGSHWLPSLIDRKRVFPFELDLCMVQTLTSPLDWTGLEPVAEVSMQSLQKPSTNGEDIFHHLAICCVHQYGS